MTSATTDRRRGLTADKGFKAPVDVATTGNITLSGEQTIDGVLTSTSRVLVKNQTNTVLNGYYDSSSAAWTRCIDANGNGDIVKGQLVNIAGGSQAGQIYQCSASDPITVDTDPITFTLSLTASITTLSYLQAGTGAIARDAQGKMRDLVNVKDFGATSGSSDATNKAALQLAITAFASAGATIIVPEDISIGHVVSTKATWPSFVGVTKPMRVVDTGQGKSYAGFPTAYDGMQLREWFFTPQTTSPGQHDGNTHWIRGAWAPNLVISNDMDLSGARGALDNRRALVSYYINGLPKWGIGQGGAAGAALTDEELGSFYIQKFASGADTLGDYAPYLVERKTGNACYGLGTLIPLAHHHFGRVAGSPVLPMLMVSSDSTTADILFRDSVGVADDIVIKNVSGDLIVRLLTDGDALTIKKTSRRVQLAKSLVTAKVTVAYSASMTIDTEAGNIFQVFVTTGVGFTINAPTAPVGGLVDGQQITVRISNISGGALGAATWNAAFKMASWTNPGNGNGRSITFFYDLATPAWIEISRNAADIPN